MYLIRAALHKFTLSLHEDVLFHFLLLLIKVELPYHYGTLWLGIEYLVLGNCDIREGKTFHTWTNWKGRKFDQNQKVEFKKTF
jgi:hypothetical protein